MARHRPTRSVAAAAVAAAAAAAAAAVAAATVVTSPLTSPAAPPGAAVAPLAVSARAFAPTELVGTFVRFIAQGDCPVTVAHMAMFNPMAGVYNLPFADIAMDGAPCTSPGSLIVLRHSDARLTGRLAELLATNPTLRAVYGRLVESGAGFLAGFESIDRVCGAATFEAPTVSLFVGEDVGIEVPRVAYLRPESRPYMLVFPGGATDAIPCTYSSAVRLSGQPSPVVVVPLDGVSFDDDDDAEVVVVPVEVPARSPVPSNSAAKEPEGTPAQVDDDDGSETADNGSVNDDSDGILDPSDADDDNDGVAGNDDAGSDSDDVAELNEQPRNGGQDEDEGAPLVPAMGGADTDSMGDDSEGLADPTDADDGNDGLADPSDADEDSDGDVDNVDAANDGDRGADVNGTPSNGGQEDDEADATDAPAASDEEDGGVVGADDENDDGAQARDGTGGAPLGGDPEPLPSDELASTGDDDSACFPASAEVELESGATVAMDRLAVGDSVRVSADAFSRVFLFTHKVPAGSFRFVQLSTASAASLTVTPGHYVYVNGKMTAAGAVTLGDKLDLVAEAKCDVVTAIAPVTATGLYNPQTLHGDIVVNGLRASTYTTAVEPAVASALLSPLRALFRMTGISTSALEAGSARLAALLPSGSTVVVRGAPDGVKG